MKRLSKKEILINNMQENVQSERNILIKVNHPFIVKMHHAFQDADHLYMLLDYCPGGELFFYLQRVGRFREIAAQFYAANIILAMQYLHVNNILFRDLKPENVLVDSDGYLKLTDFGLSKEMSSKKIKKRVSLEK